MMSKLKIGDISKIYKLSLDSLRYYERIGLISPSRQDNKYREYNYVDIWKLNIIKELRALNFTFTDIGEYLNHRTLETTKALIIKSISLIDREIQRFNNLKTTLSHSLQSIKDFEKLEIDESIKIIKFPERACIQLSEIVPSFDQVNFYFRKLQLRSNETIPLIGNKKLCIFMPEELLGLEEQYYSLVFSFVPNTPDQVDFTLPSGEYLSIYFRGDHHQSRMHAVKLLEYARSHNYEITTQPFEITIIDIHETSLKSEYVTEVQLGIHTQHSKVIHSVKKDS